MPAINFANPAIRTIAATVGCAFAGQVAAASIAVPLKTEKYYDLSGSLGFLSCTAFSLYFPALRARLSAGTPLPSPLSFHTRQILVSAFTAIWAGRLGTFLFQRIQKHGSDSRFDDIKPHPIQFFGAWMAQATWVSITALPVYMVNAIPTKAQPPMGPRDYLGAAIWLGAFLFEVTADRQKSAWRAAKDAKEHDEQFITKGLWSLSRHPNYFGEVSLWLGQAVIAASVVKRTPGLLPPWAAAAAFSSPLLEYCLIRFVSGVPMLEKSSDKKYGDIPAYQEYKKNTPVFFPKLW